MQPVSTLTYVMTALEYLHTIEANPGVLAALAQAKATGSLDWVSLLIAIGQAVYSAAGNPSIQKIIAIIEGFITPAPTVPTVPTAGS